MTELLNIYNDNLQVIFNKINRLIPIFTNQTIEKFELHSKDIEINLKEAERMLKKIDLELITNSNLSNSEKTFFNKNYEIFKEKYEKSKKQFFLDKENFDYTKKKEDLINKEKIEMNTKSYEDNSYNADENNENNEKIQLQINQNNQNLANNSSKKLTNATLNLLKTENVSKNVMIDLEGNSNKIRSSRMKMQNLNENLDASNNFIKKIFDKDSRSKTVAFTLALTIASLLFYYMRIKI